MNKSKIEGLAIPAGAKRCSFKGLTAILLGFLLAGFLLLGSAMSALADDQGNVDIATNGCMEDVAGFGLNCSANDFTVAIAEFTVIDEGCSFPGDTVNFKAKFAVSSGTSRHDIGLWFATDGDPNDDGAMTGECTVATPAYGPAPWVDLDGTGDTFFKTNDVSNIQDTCGDIYAGVSLLPEVEITAKCIDTDGDGKLNLPICASWKQPGDNDLCTGPLLELGIGGEGLGSSGVPPGAPSKCYCDIEFQIEIPVPIDLNVEKGVDADGDGTYSDETEAYTDVFPATISYQVTITNYSTADALITSASDDMHDITGTECDLAGTTILAGDTITCTFDVTFDTADLLYPDGVTNTFSVSAENDSGSSGTISDWATVTVPEDACLDTHQGYVDCSSSNTECTNYACDSNGLVGNCDTVIYVVAGTSCGDQSSGECDAADTCDGSGSCPNNNVADGTFCGDDGTECTNQDVCVNGDCQDNGFEPPDTPCDDGNECTSGTGVSEGPDLCDGQGVCTSQNLPWGSPCGDDSVTACTDADTCDGDGNCLFNNKECGSATNSSLCEYDMEPTQGDCSVDGAPCIFDQGCVDLGGISCTAAEECLDAEGNYLGDCSPDTACLGDCEQSDQFRLIFTPDVQNWLSYKLNGSNPGQTYYNMMYDTTAAAAANASVTLTVTIPYPYVTVGGNPLHVYDAATVGSNGYGCLEPGQGISSARVIITLDDWINGTQNGDNNLNCDQVVGPGGSGNCTFQFTVPANKLPDSNMLYANIHLDYGLKGNSVDANPYDFLEDRYDRHAYISPWGSSDALVDGDSDDGDLALADCQAYWFQHNDEPGVPAKLFEDQLQNLNVFKKIAGTFGRVYCADDDTGFAGYELKLVHPVYGTVQESTTDEEGYYALYYRHKGRPTYYTVKVYDGSENLVESEVIELQGNGWLDLRFSAMDCGSDPVWSSTLTYGSGRNKNNK